MADRLYLDSNVLISIVESPSRLTEGQARLVGDIEDGRILAASSDLALAECLVRPMMRDDRTWGAAFVAMFESGAFVIVPLDRPVLVEAARQRALHRVKLPDAMHVAAAVVGGCNGFVTADGGIHLPQSLGRVAWDALAEPGDVG